MRQKNVHGTSISLFVLLLAGLATSHPFYTQFCLSGAPFKPCLNWNMVFKKNKIKSGTWYALSPHPLYHHCKNHQQHLVVPNWFVSVVAAGKRAAAFGSFQKPIEVANAGHAVQRWRCSLVMTISLPSRCIPVSKVR